MNRSKGNEALGLFLVVLSGVVLTYGLAQRFDLMPSDDDVYFENGLKAIHQHQPLPVQMAPLFSGWYLLLNAFTRTIIDTQYASWTLLSVLPGLAFYGLLRSLRINVVVSTALSVLFLYSPLNFPLDQKVSAFTMLWLMGGLIVSNYLLNPVHKLTAAAAGALLATYARPEFFLSFLALCALAAGWYFWQRRRAPQPLPYPLLALLASAGLLILLFGSPLSGQRSIIAFAQHFAMNYATWHPEIDASPWMHSKTFVVHGFGREVTSIGDAFFLNPSLFMRHIGTNLLALVTHTGHFVYAMLVTPWLSELAFPGRRYLLLLLVVVAISMADWRRTWQNLRSGFRQDGWYWLSLLVILAPTFISCILLLPRDHYVVFQMMLYVSLAGIVLRAYTFRPLPSLVRGVGYGLASLLLLAFLWPHWQLNRQPKPTPLANLIRALDKIPIQGTINMTGNVSMMYRLYLGQNWHYLYLDQYRPSDMHTFVAQNSINCLHIRPDVEAQYGRDPFFASLIADPAAAGYQKYSINVPDQYVLVQQPAVAHSTYTH